MKIAATIILLMVFVLIHLICTAQNLSNYSVGAYIGAGMYTGDLTASKLSSYRTPGFLFGITADRKLTNNLNLTADLLFTKLKGDESKFAEPGWRQARNFRFETNVTEIDLALSYTPLPHTKISPFIKAGLGYSFLKVKPDYSQYDIEYFGDASWATQGLQIDKATDLPKGKIVIPMGAGITVRLSRTLTLMSETVYRVSSTDYLDGVSRSANAERNDGYLTNSIGLKLHFPAKNNVACPKY
jgi:hypothetical protein